MKTKMTKKRRTTKKGGGLNIIPLNKYEYDPSRENIIAGRMLFGGKTKRKTKRMKKIRNKKTI